MKRVIPLLVIVSLLGLMMFLFFIPQIFKNVGPGEAGVLWRRFFGGTVTDVVYGEGIQIIFPWDNLYVYNVRTQQSERELNVLTQEGLQAKLVISVRYHPEYNLIGVLHQRIGPDYAETVIFPEVDASLRAVIGSMTAEELYTTTNDTLTRVLTRSIKELVESYISIDAVIIKNIELPQGVQSAIDNKIQQKHRAEAVEFLIEAARKEAVRNVVEAEGLAKANTLIDGSLSSLLVKNKMVDALKELAQSSNSKTVVIGTGSDNVPIILGTEK
jgi:regulator of protease activity HflC (stomatin/prohibitin superfamily)